MATDYIKYSDLETEVHRTMDMQDLYLPVHFLMAARNVPAADVRPVVRGKWIDIRPINQSTFERIAIKGAYNKCSLCGRLCFFPENFCPKCGADMREVQTDG